MTYDEEQEVIEREFILTIRNNGKWYEDTRDYVEGGRYEDFADICHDYTDQILRRTGMSTTSATDKRSDTCMLSVKTRVALLLWESENVPDSKVTGKGTLISHRDHVREISRIGSKSAAFNQIKPQPESETIVNITPAFQTKHYIFGQDVSAMSTSQLIDSIKRVEKEIADLKAVATTSTKIGAMVEDLTSMLAKIVEVLDAQK